MPAARVHAKRDKDFEMAESLVRTTLAIFSLALVLLPGPARAQQAQFPTRPITLIVPFAPGGATDIVARLLATRIGEDLGQMLVVDNRTGGAGNIGTASAARAAPDGYTLVLATTSQLINQFLSKTPPFNLFTDLVPVALIADAPEVIAISSKIPAGTLAEFARAAQADAAGFNYGSPGTGSVPHLGGEVLARAMKTKMVHVPFRGSADAAKEIAAGNIQLTLATQATVAPFVESNLVKIIAAAAPHRLRTLPTVPTTAEAGFPGVELSNWFGIMAPRGTSPRLVSLLNRSFNKALAHPEIESALLRQGIEPVRQTPEQFAARLQEDAQTYQKLLDDFGLAPK
jgi:tripartite-type tricarboxylate transporter receptor subunit TctC